MILGFSEMQEEDRPDESVWLDEVKLLAHFDARQQAMRDKYGAGKGDGDEDWDDWSKGSEIVQNELADEMLREVGAK